MGTEAALKSELVAVVRRLEALGLNRGTTGNVSARSAAGGFWITPTGMDVAALSPGRLVRVGDGGQVLSGRWQPSSEWAFHAAVYRQRPDLHAVIHVHSTHATALACLRRKLPAFHYMVAIAGGDDVPLVPYQLFGTEALSKAVQKAFVSRQAALLANHGLVTGGRDLAQSLKVCVEIESLCESYLLALASGEPRLLGRAEMAAVLERFRSYGSARHQS
jgi:L-fuculose-phosphate aldolase